MLYNDSKEYPGRYVLLDIIKDQREDVILNYSFAG